MPGSLRSRCRRSHPTGPPAGKAYCLFGGGGGGGGGGGHGACKSDTYTARNTTVGSAIRSSRTGYSACVDETSCYLCFQASQVRLTVVGTRTVQSVGPDVRKLNPLILAWVGCGLRRDMHEVFRTLTVPRTLPANRNSITSESSEQTAHFHNFGACFFFICRVR